MSLTWDNRQKGKGNYYLRGTIRGQTIYETTGTDDPKAAEEICIQRSAEILRGSIFGRKSVVTFAEAASRYLTQGGDARFVGTYDEETGKWDGLIGYFGTDQMMTIDQSRLDRAAVELYPDAIPDTRNRQVYTPFIAVWNSCVPDLCDARDWHRPKLIGNTRKRWCTLDDFQRLHRAAAPHLRDLMLFLVLTGCRPIEAFRLDWKDADLTARWVVFRNTKNGEDRGVALHQDLVVMLANLKHRKGKVFHTNRGEAFEDKDALGGGQVKSAWASAVRKAGFCKTGYKMGHRRRRMADGSIGDRYQVKVKTSVWAKGEEPLVLYSLRHTGATWLLMAGVTEQVKDEIIGHASTAMGRRYAHVPRDYIVAAIDMLPRVNSVYAETGKRKKA